MFWDFRMRVIVFGLMLHGVVAGFCVGADRGLLSQADRVVVNQSDRTLPSQQDNDEAILQVLAQFQQSTVLEIDEAVHFLEQLLHQAEKTGDPNAVLEVAKELSRALFHKNQPQETMERTVMTATESTVQQASSRKPSTWPKTTRTHSTRAHPSAMRYPKPPKCNSRCTTSPASASPRS
jgi:acetyl/propionyl-CoA carboxylase alpha subunit